MARFVFAPLIAVAFAGAAYGLADAMNAFPAYRQGPAGSLSGVAGLTLVVAAILCVVLVARRATPAFTWFVAPVYGALVLVGYYVHTAPYCRVCRDSTTLPSARPWVFAVAATCGVAGIVAARWPRLGLLVTGAALLGAIALGLVIGYYTIS